MFISEAGKGKQRLQSDLHKDAADEDLKCCIRLSLKTTTAESF